MADETDHVVHIKTPKDLLRIFHSMADDGSLATKNWTMVKEFWEAVDC
jgi:hypothetical protein